MSMSPVSVQFRRPIKPRLWLVIVFAIAAGAAGEQAWPVPATQGPVWPLPPDLPRIRYVAAISEPKDIGAGPSWLGRAASVIFGRKRQPRLMRPRATAVDRSGRLLIADPEQRMVHVLDVGSRQYSYLEPAPFASPVGLAVGADNSIYVTDSGRRRVFVYGSDGRRRSTLGVVNGEAIFVRPTGIAVGPDGRLYVADTAACTITTMTGEGRVLRVVGRRGTGEGEFNFPTDIAVGRDNRLFVVDSMNARLQVFDADGRFLRQFGRRGNGTGDIDKPKGVALDSDGHVYVAEGMHDVVQIFDQEGRLLLVVGGSGSRPGEFSLPSSVYIDRADRLYVADALNGRVQVFQYVRQPDAQ
jgi:DNA-binding beta-propeller fold protein YncE